MTSTCSTCRHWERPDPEDVFDAEYNPRPDLYGRCASAESDDGEPKLGARPVHPAYAMDASGYHASLRTLPTFGCSEWRSKESTEEEKRANTAALVRPTMESMSRR
ncbi:MAG: hypothetical protein V4479_07445 [Actinomycetota bacterium]